MLKFSSPSFLRRVLLADAAASAITGLSMLSGAVFLEQLLGLPATLLQVAGAILLPFAVLVVLLATRERPAPAAVWAVIISNALWAIDSVLLLLSGWVAPNGLGQAFVIAQAVVVAVFAELEYFAVRRTAAAVHA